MHKFARMAKASSNVAGFDFSTRRLSRERNDTIVEDSITGIDPSINEFTYRDYKDNKMVAASSNDQ